MEVGYLQGWGLKLKALLNKAENHWAMSQARHVISSVTNSECQRAYKYSSICLLQKNFKEESQVCGV